MADGRCERLGGNYIDAIEEMKMVAATSGRATKVQRLRVNDNLPGIREFCPIVVKTEAMESAAALEVPRLFGELTDEFGEDLLLRAAVMQAVREHIGFEATQTTYPDGVVSNFVFHADDQARPLWRYPDLGPHVVFLANIIGRTLTEQMREESRYLRGHARARAALKEVVEMPDHQADRVLRSIEQNRGELSNVLAKEVPVLTQPGVWAGIVDAVSQALREAGSDRAVIDRYRPDKPVGR